MLDRLVALALVIQALRHAELSVKQQAVIVAGDFQVQGKTDAPQQMQTLIEFVTFGFGQKTKPDHFVQRCCPKMATGDPLQRVDIAQATGAAFNIRFEIIAGTVIALVALVLFFDFRSEEFFRRPEAVAKDVLLQFEEQRHVANQEAGFNQVGGDGQVR